MTCHHRPGDPDCSSNRISYYTPPVETPDSKNYEVVDAMPVGKHLVLKVKYPNCKSCAFEGVKTLVYLNCAAIDALRWKEIDPHFKDDSKFKFNKTKNKSAPSPAARFPASLEGWNDAVTYAKSK